jgi:mannan endo-1,4-beta-mannosidase
MLFILVLATLQVCSAQNYFRVSNGKILDPNGAEFLIRGINNMHVPYDAFGKNWARDSLPAISATGANTLRLVWYVNLTPFTGLSIGYLDDLIQRAINNKLVVVLEMHDATGSNNVADLRKCAQWFKDNSWLLFKYQRYLLVNIANEFVSFVY